MKDYVRCNGQKLPGEWYRFTGKPLMVVITNAWDDADLQLYLSHLRESDAQVLLLIREIADGTEVCCFSVTPRIKAIEFMDFMFGSYGVMKGDRELAIGKMPSVLLMVQMEECGDESPAAYFMRRAALYYSETDSIEALYFVAENETRVSQIPKYHKKAVKWAFVKTLDIAPAGQTLCIKSLESEDGVCFASNENLYIMIGCLGEVYEIARAKFENSYVETGEKLDVFDTFFDFMPAVELPEDGTYCAIDELANICYPKPGTGILAVALERRTKIYRKDSVDYFVGNPGDYMAIRCDDMTDIYIIQKEVFLRTYEEVAQ